MRTFWGGLVGGVVLFAWGSLAHMVLGWGAVGIQSLPSEEPVMEAMRASIQQPGLYFFPGIAPGQENDEAAMKVWEEKARKGPAGLMVYQVTGEGMTTRQLLTEFGSNVLIGLLAAIVVAQLAGGFGARTFAVTLMGLAASLDINVSYWNWFKFPGNYTLAQSAIEVVGFALMGAAIAAIVKKQ